MAEPRKVFRIEESAATRLGDDVEDAPAHPLHAQLMAELTALRAMLAAAYPWQSGKPEMLKEGETGRLSSELNLIAGAIRGTGERTGSERARTSAPMTRIAHELEAVVNGTEQATQKVLAAAEEIDQVANNLSAALKGRVEQGFAQDIQDLVIRIFEACNFQDLAGQRVTKVMSALHEIEGHIACVLDEIKHAPTAARRDGAQQLHGPRLDSDAGHVPQGDIDAMFGGKKRLEQR